MGEGSSLQAATFPRPPPDLPPINHLHIREQDHTIKKQVLLDLSIPPTGTGN